MKLAISSLLTFVRLSYNFSAYCINSDHISGRKVTNSKMLSQCVFTGRENTIL